MAANFINMSGKVVIITGASAGIGEAAAMEFARQGCHLMLCGRDQGRLDKVVENCQKEGGSSTVVKQVRGDLTEDSIWKKIVADTIEAFGQIDVLVNNAGAIRVRDLLSTQQDDYNFMMKTNIESTFFLTQAAVPHLIKTKGNIVNVSSIGSKMSLPKGIVYAMTKAAMDSFSRSLALDLAPSGVRVNCVNPASVESMLYRRGPEAMSEEQYAEFKRVQGPTHPMGRLVLPSEVADAIVYLASPRASYITGEIIVVDGGRLCNMIQPKYNIAMEKSGDKN